MSGHGGLIVLLGLGANWCGERRDATAGAALAAGACGRQVAALRRWHEAGTLYWVCPGCVLMASTSLVTACGAVLVRVVAFG